MARSSVWLVLAVAGCDRTYSPCSGGNAEAEGAVDVSGEVPVFDWDYGTAYALSVYEVDGNLPGGGPPGRPPRTPKDLGRSMWHIQCGGDNLENDERIEEQVCIDTPIAYGDEVRSAYFDTVNFTRPKELEPGVTYRVMLDTMIEDDGPRIEPDNPVLAEVQSWTPDREDQGCGSAFSAEVDFELP